MNTSPSGRLLIKGGTVLSLDRGVGNLTDADVLVDGGRIAEVGRSLRAKGADVVDAANTIVMPGFVDAHRHLSRSLARSGHDAAAFTPDDVYAATLLGLLQALEAGVTTVVDWCDLPDDPALAEAARSAHADAGAHTMLVPAGSPDSGAAGVDEIGRAWVASREAGRRIHAHARHGGVVAELGQRGLLGADVTLAHCTGLTDADFDAIARAGAGVVLTPASDMAAGAGPPPIQQLIDRSIRPGLGAGTGAVAPRDLFAQMRAVISVQHAVLFDLKLAGKSGIPSMLGTREVIRYATIDGARAAGLGEVTGSLTPGKRADVILLRTDRPNIAPVNDPIGAVVWGMDSSNVDLVLVGGTAVVEHGELVADRARARGLSEAAHARLAAAGAAPS